MQELLETIVKGIVNNPDQVSVEQRSSVDFPGLTILEISVADEDKGILIGRRGRTINAIRDLMTISAIRNSEKIKVLVHDDRDRQPQKAPTQAAPESAPQQQQSQQAPVVVEEKTEENKPAPGNSIDEETDDLLNDSF